MNHNMEKSTTREEALDAGSPESPYGPPMSDIQQVQMQHMVG